MSSHEEELREAARAMLKGQFVTGAAAAAVRRHRRALAELFHDELGWQISADDRGPVRAMCKPGVAHVARGLTTRSGRPFDPMRYALLFLVLASLEAAGSRITLAVLFEQVNARTLGLDRFTFDPNLPSHRRAFVHAVQAVVDLTVLELADGNEEAFAVSGEGDALYRVDRASLTHILATSKPPSLAADAPSAVAENLYTPTDEGQVRRRRHRLTRALVGEPVVYRDDLTEAEIAYLQSQEPRLRRLLNGAFGLTLEVRAEGWVAVDPDGGLTDLQFPSITAARAAALAIVDASRSRRGVGGCTRWPWPEVEAFTAGLASRFGESWTLDAGNADAVTRMAAESVQVLVDMRLAGVDGDEVVVRPAAGRFALSTNAEGAGPEALELL